MTVNLERVPPTSRTVRDAETRRQVREAVLQVRRELAAAVERKRAIRAALVGLAVAAVFLTILAVTIWRVRP